MEHKIGWKMVIHLLFKLQKAIHKKWKMNHQVVVENENEEG
jgi:hypothetical protein